MGILLTVLVGVFAAIWVANLLEPLNAASVAMLENWLPAAGSDRFAWSQLLSGAIWSLILLPSIAGIFWIFQESKESEEPIRHRIPIGAIVLLFFSSGLGIAYLFLLMAYDESGARPYILTGLFLPVILGAGGIAGAVGRTKRNDTAAPTESNTLDADPAPEAGSIAVKGAGRAANRPCPNCHSPGGRPSCLVCRSA